MGGDVVAIIMTGDQFHIVGNVQEHYILTADLVKYKIPMSDKKGGLNDFKSLKKEVFIMIMRDLLDLVSKKKRKKVRVNEERNFGLGMRAVATVGVGSGILLAPKLGKESRKR